MASDIGAIPNHSVLCRVYGLSHYPDDVPFSGETLMGQNPKATLGSLGTVPEKDGDEL